MRTNAWVTVERDRALSWQTWLDWYHAGGDGDEPPLSNYEKNVALKLSDQTYLFKGFLRPTILMKVWIMLSLYDVTESQIDNGYAQLGDAVSGGDFGCAGFWQWDLSMSFCQWISPYGWHGGQVLQFMPPTYTAEGVEIPATGVRDVNVMLGQPPREFPV